MRDAAPALLLVAALISAGAALFPAAAMPSGSPEAPEEIRHGYEQVAREIICWCGCARQSLYECTCGASHGYRADIEAELQAGRSPDEVLAGLIGQHGDGVLLVPRAAGFDLIAWVGPGITIVLAGGVVFLILLKWSRRSPPAPIRPVPTEQQEASREAYRERLARDLSGLDP